MAPVSSFQHSFFFLRRRRSCTTSRSHDIRSIHDNKNSKKKKNANILLPQQQQQLGNKKDYSKRTTTAATTSNALVVAAYSRRSNDHDIGDDDVNVVVADPACSSSSSTNSVEESSCSRRLFITGCSTRLIPIAASFEVAQLFSPCKNAAVAAVVAEATGAGKVPAFSPTDASGVSVSSGDFSSSSTTTSSSTTSSSTLSFQQQQPFSVYKIFPDASAKLSPSIQSVDPTVFLESEIFQNTIHTNPNSHTTTSTVTTTNTSLRHDVNQVGGVIWLGEHHNSKQDHDLQALIIENIYNQRSFSKEHPSNNGNHNMAIGLEQIQVQYQHVLDAYIQGIISEEEMLSQCQWSKRWTWPFENYRSIFTLAKRLKIPLIALNVDSEDLARVEADGFQGLDKVAIQKYIRDPRGFSDFARPTSYRTYSAYVIEPSYELHKKMGILKSTISGQVLETDMSFRNFFSGRILWDEAMAGNAYQWTKTHRGGILIGLVGADHVKFEKGVVGRYQRLVGSDGESGDNGLNLAVLLNPTLVDTRPSGSFLGRSSGNNNMQDIIYSADYPDQITLQLRFLKDDIALSSKDRDLPSSTGGVLSLADYIVISKK